MTGMDHRTRRYHAVWLLRGAFLPVLLLCALSGCWVLPGERSHTPTGHVVIASGGTQGVYYMYARALARELESRAPGLDVEIAPTAGSVENLEWVDDGRAMLAFTADDAAAGAVNGASPFRRALPITAVSRVYDDYMHLVVPATSSVRSISDLAGRTVSVGPPGSGTALIVDRLFTVAGLARKSIHAFELGINESVEALRRGSIDGFFWSGGLPTSGVHDLSREVPLRLVALGELAPAMQTRFGAAYHQAAIPAGTYGLVDQVDTIAIPNFIVCRDDTDADLVRFVLSTLFSSRDAIAGGVPVAAVLDRRVAIETAPVPLHAAALRWFHDTKI
jgi:TRAP transporter TAXI family solute receptor